MRATATRVPHHARPIRAAVAVAVGLCFPAIAVIADPPRPSPIAAPDSDAILALNARAAIAADPALADLNLLVSVADRVAVVGGPVPDAALSGRVEAVLRKVAGLTDVKVSCWVPAAADPLQEMVGNRLKTASAPPTATAVASLPPVLGIRNFAPPTPAGPWAPAHAPPAADPRPVGQVTVQRVVPPPNITAFLLPPVAPPGAAVTPLPMPASGVTVPTATYPTIPPPAVPTAPADSAVELAPLLADLRAREPRFAGLTVALRGGTAVIAGSAALAADAWDLAAAVRGAAGVDRVVVGAVERR